jgi:hypothetical protein
MSEILRRFVLLAKEQQMVADNMKSQRIATFVMAEITLVFNV